MRERGDGCEGEERKDLRFLFQSGSFIIIVSVLSLVYVHFPVIPQSYRDAYRFYNVVSITMPYRDHITNEEVKARIGNAIGPYEDLLTSVKRRKLKWYGHDHLGCPRLSYREQVKEGDERQTEETMGRQHQRVAWP